MDAFRRNRTVEVLVICVVNNGNNGNVAPLGDCVKPGRNHDDEYDSKRCNNNGTDSVVVNEEEESELKIKRNSNSKPVEDDNDKQDVFEM